MIRLKPIAQTALGAVYLFGGEGLLIFYAMRGTNPEMSDYTAGLWAILTVVLTALFMILITIEAERKYATH